jgi:hypothetical protein
MSTTCRSRAVTTGRTPARGCSIDDSAAHAELVACVKEERLEREMFGEYFHTTARQRSLHRLSVRTGELVCNGRCGLR